MDLKASDEVVAGRSTAHRARPNLQAPSGIRCVGPEPCSADWHGVGS